MKIAIAGLALALSLVVPPPAGAQAPQTAPSAAPAPEAPAQARGPLIDINSASMEELQTLSGIGPARAEAIGKGRPYRSKDELLRRSIIPESVYEGIRDKVIARQS